MKFYIMDCFAENKYQGNQLLVLLPDREISEDEQQRIAKEINFSETIFVFPNKRENGGYDVRIWTPNVGEVPFAGHPVLGASYIAYHTLERAAGDRVSLNTRAGRIEVLAAADGMKMRQNPPEFGTMVDKAEIADIYGIVPKEIRDDHPIQRVSTGLEAVIVPLKTRETLAKLKTDPAKFNSYIARRPECNCNHLFFVDMGNGRFSARCLMEDFVEDPATGSANGDLAGYLLHHDYFGKKEVSYIVEQGEDMGRPSVLYIHAAKNNNEWLIEVGGSCFIVAEGNWN